jgi:hypothetical protein
VNHRVAIVIFCVLAGCAFEPSGGAGDPDATGGDDDATVDAPAVDGPAIDGPAPDGPLDAPRAIDAAVDGPVTVAGLVRVAPLSEPGAADGVASEYGNSVTYAMDLALPGHRDSVTGYIPSMRADLRAAQDASHVYLFVDVFELGTHHGDSTEPWQNDAVTFYFDTNNDRSGPYGNDDHEIIIDFSPRYGIYPTTNGAADPMLEAFRVDTATGFTVETRILKSSLGTPVNGRMGFGWGLYDDDGGGNADGYGLWYERPAPRCAACCVNENHAEAWCDTTLLGEIQFN